jgi:hypothetical protein
MKPRKKILTQAPKEVIPEVIIAYLLFLIIMAGLTACDPMRRIHMRNQSAGPAEITWFIMEDSINVSPLFYSNTRKVNYSLSPDKPGNHIPLSLGLGNWTSRTLMEVADDLDSVEIRSQTGRLVLNNPEAIVQFLLPRRKGLDKSKIHIVITEDFPR